MQVDSLVTTDALDAKNLTWRTERKGGGWD